MESSAKTGSRMFYHRTRTEVQLGDRVRVKPWLFHWFRRPSNGVVCYIPGISPKHKDLEYEDVQKWAIRLQDGTILAAGYFPDELANGELHSGIEFVGRGQGGELLPDEEIDDTADSGTERD